MLSANRLAALAGSLTGLAGFVAGLAHVLPGTWPNAAIAVAGLLTKLVTVLSYLDGSKKFDALEVQRVLGIYAATGNLAGRSQGVKAAGFQPVVDPMAAGDLGPTEIGTAPAVGGTAVVP